MKISGIYKITNCVTEDCYIGSSIIIYNRVAVHKSYLNKKAHKNNHLQNSWNKYGKENFKFEAIEECEKEKLIEREQYYIDLLKPTFNIRIIAQSNLGRRVSDDVKIKISNGNKGKLISEETKKKIGESSKGRKHTEESKRKMSESKKGHIVSEITRNKLSESKKGNKYGLGNKSHLGKIPWNKGKKFKNN